VEVYSGLQTCVIEGIEALSNKFQNIFLSIKKKQYDVLDHRKPEFDRDYDEYQKYLFDLEVGSLFLCHSLLGKRAGRAIYSARVNFFLF